MRQASDIFTYFFCVGHFYRFSKQFLHELILIFNVDTIIESVFPHLNAFIHITVPLRCLILKTTDPSSYAILMDMESHNEIRQSIADLWALNQTRVVDRIIKDWKLTEFSEDEIHTICGILEVLQNGFTILHTNSLMLYKTGKRI